MTRRFAALAGALAAAISLSACTMFDRQGAAAAVDGAEFSIDDLGEVLSSPIAGGAVIEGAADADVARNVLEIWITNEIVVQAGLLGEYDAEAVRAGLAATIGDDFTNSPGVVQELLVVNSAIGAAAEAGTLDVEAARAALLEADVWVDSRYGAWSPAEQQVLPLGDG